ncbi:hypothetical protein KAFR_0B04820 [Kazachstania africana CBS 2517]|uniref:Aldehyde dehydrogenase domain-containing protein n=1 Tax=Kazachstania africana (strain ATCC 22294 / BCRC 22015 / CBS 2517 / CECT 1963 / NBRC 1671 / NRRL Y-8276) TaxID=1071382 RepID=H2AQX8_KAZAF|nr:hypothetical protein KAFR_0B04820 [Kazachstania africana CBS 2517]CCF56778.1 hypothetical protein KAFR_0B04820 [Kazachstania africana CBS 2517]
MFTEIKVPQLDLTIKQPLGLFIDNEFVKPSGQDEVDTINPSTNEKITTIPLASAEDVDKAVKAARKAYTHVWAKTTPDERGKLLLKLGDLIERDIKILAALESIDAGKPYHTNAMMDLQEIIQLTRYFAGSVDKFNVGKVIPVKPEKFVYTIEQPYGVVAQIVPWNYPLAMASWKIQGALAAGNTIVIKPAENTSLSLLYLAKLFVEAGFPKGVLNVVPGAGGVVGNSLAKHEGIDKLSFTGSTSVGAKMLEQSGNSNLKDVTLELGGKSPAVVFADANLDNAIQWIASGIFFNTGQNCTANSRIYVEEGIYDTFMEKFREHTRKNWKFGEKYDMFDKECTVGPVISEKQYKSIKETLEGKYANKSEDPSQWKLEELVECRAPKGFFIPPTIITNVSQNSSLMQNEIFGPVACVCKFKNYEEVIELANDTHYGLASAVFTENIRKAHRFARDILAGTVWINVSNDVEISAPFGGFKMSGIGRELGYYGVETYLQTKSVHVNTEY